MAIELQYDERDGYWWASDGAHAIEFRDIMLERGEVVATTTVRNMETRGILEWGRGTVANLLWKNTLISGAASRDGDDKAAMAALVGPAVMLLYQAVKPPTEIPDLLPIGELVSTTDITEHHVVQGLYERGMLYLLGGAAKSGKTLYGLQLLKSITKNQQFLGRNIVPRPNGQPHQVAYVFAEDSPRTIARRALRVFGDDGLPPNCKVIAAPFRLSEANFHQAVERFAGFSVIIFDPLLVVANIDDLNEAGQVRQALGLFQQLARITDAAVIIAHHVRKDAGDGTPTDQLLGSGQLQAVPDGLVIFKRAPNGLDECKVLHYEGREWPAIEPEVIRLDSNLNWNLEGGYYDIQHEVKQQREAEREQQRKEKKANELWANTYALWRELPPDGSGITKKEAATRTGLSSNTIGNLIKDTQHFVTHPVEKQEPGGPKFLIYRGEQPTQGMETGETAEGQQQSHAPPTPL